MPQLRFARTSACTIHLIRDNRWFRWLRSANISIRTANDMTELAKEQGAALLHCYTSDGQHAPLLFHDAAHAPTMHSLISVSKLLDVGVKVLFDKKASYIEFPNGTRVPVRRSRGLFMLDFLVPLDHAGESRTGSDVWAMLGDDSETSSTGSEAVPDARVAYPDAIPVAATPAGSTAMLNHWRWGHLDVDEKTRACTTGMHGQVHTVANCPCCVQGAAAARRKERTKAVRASASVPLGQVSIDLHGPYPIKSLGGHALVRDGVCGRVFSVHVLPFASAEV